MNSSQSFYNSITNKFYQGAHNHVKSYTQNLLPYEASKEPTVFSESNDVYYKNFNNILKRKEEASLLKEIHMEMLEFMLIKWSTYQIRPQNLIQR